MDEAELRKIVSEEVERSEIRALITKKQTSRAGRLWDQLRHPVLLAIFGFCLSTIFGTFIAQMVADRRERDLERSNALGAVSSFATEASELRVLQSYLLDALERYEEADELRKAKVKYDDAFLQWQSARYRNFLTIRSFFGFTETNFSEQAITQTIHQDFKVFNSCLNDVYVTMLARALGGQPSDIVAQVQGPMDPRPEQDARQLMNTCLSESGRPGVPTEQWGYVDAFDRWQERVFQCSRQNFDVLHHFVAHDYHCGTGRWLAPEGGKANVEVIYDVIVKQCATGNVKPYTSFDESFGQYCTKEDGGLISRLVSQ